MNVEFQHGKRQQMHTDFGIRVAKEHNFGFLHDKAKERRHDEDTRMQTNQTNARNKHERSTTPEAVISDRTYRLKSRNKRRRALVLMMEYRFNSVLMYERATWLL